LELCKKNGGHDLIVIRLIFIGKGMNTVNQQKMQTLMLPNKYEMWATRFDGLQEK
jgi:hypothetical protein